MADAEKIKNNQLEQIESELEAFYDFCKQSQFSKNELDIIYKQLKSTTGQNICIYYRRLCLLLGILLLFFAIVYYTISEEFLMHVRAIVRILLIKILPFWNWKGLHLSKCLIKSTTKDGISYAYNIKTDCTKCESITTINIENSLAPEYFKDRYLALQEPVIISDWPDRLNEDFTEVANILNDDPDFAISIPCDLSSNLLSSSTVLSSQLLYKASDPIFTSWFFHFRNCDLKAFKAMRLLFTKPSFFSNVMRPSHTNWLIASFRYSVRKYKTINLQSGVLAVFAQLKGSNQIGITPNERCITECDILNFTLFEGESVIFDTYNWNLTYKPTNESFVSVAVLSEIFWNDG